MLDYQVLSQPLFALGLYLLHGQKVKDCNEAWVKLGRRSFQKWVLWHSVELAITVLYNWLVPRLQSWIQCNWGGANLHCLPL